MAGDVFLGIDVGTSGVKVIVVGLDGAVQASTTAPLDLDTPQPGWAEQHPDRWWEATITAVRDVLASVGDTTVSSIAGIGISGQMHSSVFLDARGNVIRPALLWCDGRTTAECNEIVERVGGERELAKHVCNPALEGFTLPKVLWLRNHEPEAYRRTAKVLLAKDYIRFRLAGTLATEPSDASGTLMFDPAQGRWSDAVLRAVDVPPDLLPDVGGSSEVLGRVNAEGARATGLTEGTPVVGGGADNACGAAGVGAVTPGETVASWGTSGTVLAPTNVPLVDSQLRVHTFNHVAPGTWYNMGVVLSAGGAFAWYRDRFAVELAGSADVNERLNREAATVLPGAEGVTFLPYLQGERTPHRDAAARAAFVGLSLAHTRAHLTRAVIEGICFALLDSVMILRELGHAPAQLLLTGGGAGSPFIRRMQADVFGLPVQTVNREEGPAFGAALLAAVGTGAFPDLSSAADVTLVRSSLEQPDARAHEQYREPYALFRSRASAALGAAATHTVRDAPRVVRNDLSAVTG